MRDEQRFWVKVRKSSGDGCWEWIPAYLRFQFKGKKTTPTRAGYEIQTGVAPGRKHVLHTCDNNRCVRGSHLYLGTPKDNARDMVSRGRHGAQTDYFGEVHHAAKLTAASVRWARAQHDSGALTVYRMAKVLGVGQQTLWSAINRKTWKHVA